MSVLTEVCVDSVAGVRVAAAAGADRVELCSALPLGGLTPSIALIEQAVAASSGSGLRVHVLIRPRPGDFVYTVDEIRCMDRDIAAAAAAGAHGVVIGALRIDGSVDDDVLARLVATARTAGGSRRLSITFHRAFDLTADPFAALEAIRRTGIDRILTSGQAATAPAGAELLAALVRRSGGSAELGGSGDPGGSGEPIAIMAGAGIRPENVGELLGRSGVPEVHFSARRAAASPVLHRNPGVSMGADEADDRTRGITDADAVRATIDAVRAVPAGG